MGLPASSMATYFLFDGPTHFATEIRRQSDEFCRKSGKRRRQVREGNLQADLATSIAAPGKSWPLENSDR